MAQRRAVSTAGLCLLFSLSHAAAQTPLLLVTGLPCPGGQGEPTNSHPLVWQCRSACDKDKYLPWVNWQDTVQIGYGDVVAVTWFDQCRSHQADWPFLRLDVVTTNQSGYHTNTSTVKMKAGYNFDVSYIYWYTNSSSLLPTNFDAAQVPALIGSNHCQVLSVPVSLRGTNIGPPIWEGGTNPITNPANWPLWGNLPVQATNADGVLVIDPAVQLPVCGPRPLIGGDAPLRLQGIPGSYTIQAKGNLSNSWIPCTNVVVGPDGTANLSLPFRPPTNLFLRASGLGPSVGFGYLARFQTVGSAFEPMLSFDAGPPQQLLWSWSDNTTSTDYPIASKDFGSAATRNQSLKVYPAAALTAINLGFDGSDGGENTPLTNRPPQDVSAVYFPYPLTGLRYWASSYNPIANTLDFSGFTGLEYLECFHCSNLQHVAVANLPSLKRVCFESCDLQELDLSGDPNLADVRAALNSFTEVKVGAGTGPKIWHFCVRDNPQITQDFQDITTNFYSLQEPWIWNANQSGALSFVSTNLTDVEIYNNSYSSADFTGQANLQLLWAENNNFTNVLLTGCVGLLEVRLQNNLLTAPVLDALLALLDTSAPNLQLLDLVNNAELPSAMGYSHYMNLTNRGVVVYLDFPNDSGPVVTLDSTTLTAESCLPTNNAIDPGETVTVVFNLKNVGTADTTNLVVTLLEINGVVSPSGPQSYGALLAGGSAIGQPFTFTAAGACGDTITAAFQLQDGSAALGPILVPLRLGQTVTILAQDFDTDTPPAMASGWTTSASGAQSAWTTANDSSDTPPNAAYSPDPPNPGVNELVSPAIALPASAARLTFRNNYDLEPDAGSAADDGGVLEIQIGTNSFTDILAAGGSFVSGGYTSTITNIYSNPLAGRQAWSGNSGGYITTVVNLPAAAQGQTVRLRWRCATDNGNGGTYDGWRIDTITITAGECCSGPALAGPAQTSRVSTGRKSSL